MSESEVEDNSQKHMQEVLTSMPVGVAWANIDDGKIQFVNQKFISMFGYKLSDLTTVHDWIEQCYIVPEQAQKIDGFWQSKSDSSTESPAELEEVELSIICKDKSIKTVLSGKILLPNDGGALSTFLDITPRIEEEQIIKKQALEDPLTGLLNKRAFSQILQDTITTSTDSSELLSLLMLDLDGFKNINDTLGHDQGDKLLQIVAERLKRTIRNFDSLCRIGGDEFAIILNKFDDESYAEIVANRIIKEISKQFNLHSSVVSIGVSIGIANCAKDIDNEESLFKLADQALYRAKNTGKGKWSR